MSGRPLREMSLDELGRLGEEDEAGSVDHGRMMAELARRQTIAQIEATQAQKTAAEAEEKAAKAIVETALHTDRAECQLSVLVGDRCYLIDYDYGDRSAFPPFREGLGSKLCPLLLKPTTRRAPRR